MNLRQFQETLQYFLVKEGDAYRQLGIHEQIAKIESKIKKEGEQSNAKN
tara:strand:- start:108 stop:254 length:147 start_codon:yes stop_codon:yes gene_type:complete